MGELIAKYEVVREKFANVKMQMSERGKINKEMIKKEKCKATNEVNRRVNK